jgi:hypothetical protein
MQWGLNGRVLARCWMRYGAGGPKSEIAIQLKKVGEARRARYTQKQPDLDTMLTT